MLVLRVGLDIFLACPEKAQEIRGEDPRQLRNHIAHGLLRIGLAEDRKTPVLTLSLPTDLDGSGCPKARHLTYQKLLRVGTEPTALIED